MNSYSIFRRVILGFKKKPLKALISIFIVYATIWAVLDPLISFIPKAEKYFSGELKFFTLVLVSSLVGLYKNAVPEAVSLKYGNSTINIIFGDLFSFEGFKVIPVSRYFFETQVVPTSLQNKLIQKFVQSEEGAKGFDVYEKRLDYSLQGKPYQEINRDATKQKERYYSLGTATPLEFKGEEYILFSLTETELKGHIPSDNCSVSKMWVALEGFWLEARTQSRGRSINIPLIGSGVTGIRLSPTQILEFNLLAIANAIEEGGKITTEEIRIVLHPKYMEDINLNDFQNLWV